MKKIIFSILTISFLCSCEMTMDNGKIANLNENLTTNSYLIFGAYHGECLGEDCVEIYKIENNELFKAEDNSSKPKLLNLPFVTLSSVAPGASSTLCGCLSISVISLASARAS